MVLVPQARTVAELRTALAAVERRGAMLNGGDDAAGGDPWEDFIARPADYYAMLAELGFLADDAEKSHATYRPKSSRRSGNSSSTPAI